MSPRSVRCPRAPCDPSRGLTSSLSAPPALVIHVRYEHIDNDQQLAQFCQAIAAEPYVAFDTEFVSEDTYRPQLCLIQIAAGTRLAIVDPLSLEDLRPFWNLVADERHETIVHAGREEFRFCLHAIGRRPARWFDVQMAAGFVGLEYPAAYGTLIGRLLGKSLPKGETRTDWRRRPLSQKQLEYAVHDVKYLKPLRDTLGQRLEKLNRAGWLQDELAAWQAQVEEAESSEQWRRVSGSSGLPPRQLAIVRELWRWRDAEARRRDIPARRILRDDLIVELARRQTAEPARVRAIRGMEHRGVQPQLGRIAECIRVALELPEAEYPRMAGRGDSTQPPLVLLGQFLSAALSCICRDLQLAPALVGSVQDVRDLIAYRLQLSGNGGRQPPQLARGWRQEVIGRRIEDFLTGTVALRVDDPLAEQPLAIEPLTGRQPAAAENS